jgi:hypothetical protein
MTWTDEQVRAAAATLPEYPVGHYTYRGVPLERYTKEEILQIYHELWMDRERERGLFERANGLFQ